MYKEYNGLFQEYLDQTSKEAEIAMSFDKIQPLMTNIMSKGRAWKEHNITHEKVDNLKRKYMLHDPFILKLYDKLLTEALDKDLIKKK